MDGQATNGWDWPFILLIVGCLLAIFFMALTYKEEQYLVADRKGEKVEEKK